MILWSDECLQSVWGVLSSAGRITFSVVAELNAAIAANRRGDDAAVLRHLDQALRIHRRGLGAS